jgi:hypothetical protein
LVVWNISILIFPYNGNMGMECHLPNWRSPWFFRGVGLNHQAGCPNVCIYPKPSNGCGHPKVIYNHLSLHRSYAVRHTWRGFIPLSKWVKKNQLYTWNIPTYIWD